jgi:CxxC-x17-CxxC domain-containing protein
MMFQDQEISCGECGTRFGFSSEEQAFYADKGLDHPPRRCKPCRTTRRQQRGGGRPGPPSARGHRDHPAAGPPAGGPFVRRSRQNSHGDHDNLPWHRGGSERQAEGVWQPRHGKGPWKGGGWRAQPGRETPPVRPGKRAGRGRDEGGGAPLFKAKFGPVHGQQEPRRQGGKPAWQRDNKRSSSGGNRRYEAPAGNRRHEAPAGNRRYESPGSNQRPPSPGSHRRQREGSPSAGRQDRGPLVLHDAVCSDCSTATQVPFKPHHKMPVYCRTCLPKHKQPKSPPRGPSAGRA